MGRYTYPCPGCYQAQALDITNGQKVRHQLCAACQEKLDQGDAKLKTVAVPESE